MTEFGPDLDEAFFAVFDPILKMVLDASGPNLIRRQQLIEALLSWHAYDFSNGNEIQACTLIDAAAKHAKQFMVGPNLVTDGGHRR